MMNKDKTKVWNVRTYEWDPVKPVPVRSPGVTSGAIGAGQLLYRLPEDGHNYTAAELRAKGIIIEDSK